MHYRVILPEKIKTKPLILVNKTIYYHPQYYLGFIIDEDTFINRRINIETNIRNYICKQCSMGKVTDKLIYDYIYKELSKYTGYFYRLIEEYIKQGNIINKESIDINSLYKNNYNIALNIKINNNIYKYTLIISISGQYIIKENSTDNLNDKIECIVDIQYIQSNRFFFGTFREIIREFIYIRNIVDNMKEKLNYKLSRSLFNEINTIKQSFIETLNIINIIHVNKESLNNIITEIGNFINNLLQGLDNFLNKAIDSPDFCISLSRRYNSCNCKLKDKKHYKKYIGDINNIHIKNYIEKSIKTCISTVNIRNHGIFVSLDCIKNRSIYSRGGFIFLNIINCANRLYIYDSSFGNTEAIGVVCWGNTEVKDIILDNVIKLDMALEKYLNSEFSIDIEPYKVLYKQNKKGSDIHIDTDLSYHLQNNHNLDYFYKTVESFHTLHYEKIKEFEVNYDNESINIKFLDKLIKL